MHARLAVYLIFGSLDYWEEGVLYCTVCSLVGWDGMGCLYQYVCSLAHMPRGVAVGRSSHAVRCSVEEAGL